MASCKECIHYDVCVMHENYNNCEKEVKGADKLKEYIPKKPKEYRLDNVTYMRVLWTVRSYPKTREKLNEILESSPCTFAEYTAKKGKELETRRAFLPHTNGASNPTEDKVMQREQYQHEIDAIDKALKQIPIEYRQYIFDNVVHKIKYPDFADKTTWSRWRMRFLYFVAENLMLL